MKQIIKSILDDDLYKLTMMNAVIKKFPNAKVVYKFINRGKTEFPNIFLPELKKQIKMMEDLILSKSEKKFLLKKCYFLDPVYIDFLEGYRFDSSEIKINEHAKGFNLEIEGYWYHTILWEVPLMAIISELYFITSEMIPHTKETRMNINIIKRNKFIKNKIHYADFGSRRRFSYLSQDEFISNQLNGAKNPNFIGTSNVHFAMKHNVTPVGTHAHEWFMFHAAKYGYKMANHLAMENWTDVYRGDLGIALSDTFTTDIFLKSFDKKFAKLYDGVRHDSGDPFKFTDKIIKHYEKLGIDPKSKVIIFSDSLDVEKAIKLKEYCRNKIKCSFGIGTNFTNDVGVTPLNMVIKISFAKPEGEEWLHTIKLSDDIGKHTGNKKEIEIAKHVLNIK